MIPIDVLVIHTTSKWHSNSERVSARHNNTKYNHDTETNTPRNCFSPLEWDWNKVDGRSDYSYCEEEKDKKKSGIAALMHIYQTFVISVELVLNRSWLFMIMWVIFFRSRSCRQSTVTWFCRCSVFVWRAYFVPSCARCQKMPFDHLSLAATIYIVVKSLASKWFLVEILVWKRFSVRPTMKRSGLTAFNGEIMWYDDRFEWGNVLATISI